MDITGHPDGPPVRSGIAMTDYLAALYAYSGILLALRERDRTGKGQHVDIALFDSILSTLSMPVGILQATGEKPRRLGNAHASIAPYEVLRASDGSLMVAAGNGRLWRQLCDAVGVQHLADDRRFKTNADRAANQSALKRELEKAFAHFTVDALVARLQEFGVACGRVRTIPEALEDPQIEPRQMLIPLEDPELHGFRVLGNPIKLSENPPRLYRRPPKLGEHTAEVLNELKSG
jgi:formyl-CoA transferase/CoA:oxalate CoA-transferase